MSQDQNHQGQYPPPQWTTQPPPGPYPPGPYPPPPPGQHYPPPQPNNVGLPPQTQDMAHLPSPYHMVYPPPPDAYRPPPQPINMQYNNQPAPRQRTAIACRYCRRRKIRCSGFDSSEDGRCSNCIRFNQQCLFTPVSSQAQAFVPAHTAYPHLRNTSAGQPVRGGARGSGYPSQQRPGIYGAYGQPLSLPPQGQESHPPHPPPGYSSVYGPPPTEYDNRGAPPPPPEQVSRAKRPRLSSDASPSPNLAPSSATSFSQAPQAMNRESAGPNHNYEYPDPTGLAPVSPASNVTYAPSHSSQQQQLPYYGTAQSNRRASPQSAYSYDNRASGSPHGSASSIASYPYSAQQLHPPQTLPPAGDSGRTPPPIPGQPPTTSRSGHLPLSDLLADGGNSQGGRSSTDSGMVDALNKRMT
ncbi:MAG: hypothetical protein M1834_009295 [Cirrosporium novae-zelandiae]|nr:MAG: hypothetical protein M1834_009295 [Cirrosporium novae-zelandiae]